jgi:hypothetical protein
MDGVLLFNLQGGNFRCNPPRNDFNCTIHWNRNVARGREGRLEQTRTEDRRKRRDNVRGRHAPD